jgi:hypothetical protein
MKKFHRKYSNKYYNKLFYYKTSIIHIILKICIQIQN